jgi:hypothetical protein
MPTNCSDVLTLTTAVRAEARQLASTHRSAERAYCAAMRDGWAVCRGEGDAATASPSDIARRITNAQAALATARAAAIEPATAQLRVLRQRVMEIVARNADVLIRGTNSPWRHVAETLGLEWTECCALRLCDGTLVSVEPRIVRGEMRSGTASLFYRYGPGDPRAPRRERVR